MLFVFVEGGEGGHRDGGRFEADEEHEEVAGRDHEVHAEQGGQGDHVEFTAANDGALAGEPVVGLHEDEQGADAEDGFHDAAHGRVVVHAPEGGDVRGGADVEQDVYAHEEAGYRLYVFQAFRGAEYVVDEE